MSTKIRSLRHCNHVNGYSFNSYFPSELSDKTNKRILKWLVVINLIIELEFIVGCK